jgi:DNA-binding winged helix-turn-helix (wHTH) protein/TolB-like protein/Flp pilus assembly protein TadD
MLKKTEKISFGLLEGSSSQLYRFGPFQLDPGERTLTRQGSKVPITPKAFDVLQLLVQRSGHLVEKKELIESVWMGSFVEEANVCVTISMVRKALAGEYKGEGYIETIPKRGYRFIASVKVVEPDRPQTNELEAANSERSEMPLNLDPGDRLPDVSPSPPVAAVFAGISVMRPANVISRAFISFGRLITHSSVVWAALAVVFAGLASIYVMRSGKHSASLAAESAPIRSLAVLPFAADGNRDDAYLGLGMSSAVTAKLSNLGGLFVRPSSATAKYVSQPIKPQAAGREQEVDATLSGHVEHTGDRVRLTVHLTRVADGTQIWSHTFDERYTDIFTVQDLLSEQVARSIKLELSPEDRKHLTQHSTNSSRAYEAYMRGHFFMDKRTEESLRKGLGYYREAVSIDPWYAQAYSGIADSYALLGLYTGLPPTQAFPEARAAAVKALGMDRELSDAHTTLGFVDFYYEWDGDAADREFKRALIDNPSDAIAHSWSGENLAAMGRYTEALLEARLARDADPLSPAISTNAGYVFYLAGQTSEAIRSFRNAIEIDPNFPRAHYRLGTAYLRNSMYEEALSEYQKAVELSRGDPYYMAGLGQAYAAAGKLRDARRVLTDLIQESAAKYVPPYAVAQVYSSLGDKDQAFVWLDRAFEDRSTSMAYIRVDPSLGNLRTDPRFSALTQRMHFKETAAAAPIPLLGGIGPPPL